MELLNGKTHHEFLGYMELDSNPGLFLTFGWLFKLLNTFRLRLHMAVVKLNGKMCVNCLELYI